MLLYSFLVSVAIYEQFCSELNTPVSVSEDLRKKLVGLSESFCESCCFIEKRTNNREADASA